MADLDSLEQKVDDLNTNASSIFRFRDVFREIESAAKTVTTSERPRLSSILGDYRVKLPDQPTFSRIVRDARDLSEILLLATLDDIIERINSRNRAVTDLTGQLQIEINKGNADAGLLKQIKDAVDKATSTVNQVRTLIGQLTATDATTRSRITALVNAVDEISSIFSSDD
jgi:hypothetical protein